jgi:hypothetical protein
MSLSVIFASICAECCLEGYRPFASGTRRIGRERFPGSVKAITSAKGGEMLIRLSRRNK